MAGTNPQQSETARLNDYSVYSRNIGVDRFCIVRDRVIELGNSPKISNGGKRRYEVGEGQVFLSIDRSSVFDPQYSLFLSHPTRDGLVDLAKSVRCSPSLICLAGVSANK